MKRWERVIIFRDQAGRWKMTVATWACALAPYLLLANFALLALHVRFGLGRWPVPMVDNYTAPLFTLHYHLCLLTLLSTFSVALPVFFLLLFIPVFRLSLLSHMVQLFLYLAGLVLVVWLGKVDPFRFVSWFMD